MTIDQLFIAVVGAGTMGSGIAQVAAQAGCKTLVYDISQEIVDRALTRISGFIQRTREKGRLTEEAEKAILGRLGGTTRLEDLASCDAVIEAAPEDLNLKREIFKKLDSLCGPRTLLATNTSSLSVTAIAGATRHPERVLGMHFFNPPALMTLIEVIRGERTSEETMERAMRLARGLGKTPVSCRDTPGFIVNRIARSFYNEALRILEEGQADVAGIDRIMKEAGGFPMGPFELMDLIGIDINFAVTESLYASFFQDPRFRPSPIQRRMVLAGNLGRKTGRGFYTYGEK